MPSLGRRAAIPSCVWNRVSTKGERPPYHCCHTIVTYGSRYAIMFGGGCIDLASSDVYIFDLELSTWILVETGNNAIVSPRINHTAVIYKDKMIVYGGEGINPPMLYSDVLALDLKTLSWSKINEARSEPYGPGPRRLHSAQVHNGQMYVLMGDPCVTDTYCWRFDLEAHEWHAIPNSSTDLSQQPPPTLAGQGSSIDGDFFYIFGGFTRDRQIADSVEQFSNSLYRYHFPTNTWQKIQTGEGPCPSPRYGCSILAFRNHIYVFGGDDHTVDAYYGDLWMVDLSAEIPEWKELTHSSGSSRPSARSGHVGFLLHGAYYIYGGELPSSDSKDPIYSNDLFRYPLGIFAQLSLEENSTRWLSCVDPLALKPKVIELPYTAKFILDSYLPIKEEEF